MPCDASSSHTRAVYNGCFQSRGDSTSEEKVWSLVPLMVILRRRMASARARNREFNSHACQRPDVIHPHSMLQYAVLCMIIDGTWLHTSNDYAVMQSTHV